MSIWGVSFSSCWLWQEEALSSWSSPDHPWWSITTGSNSLPIGSEHLGNHILEWVELYNSSWSTLLWHLEIHPTDYFPIWDGARPLNPWDCTCMSACIMWWNGLIYINLITVHVQLKHVPCAGIPTCMVYITTCINWTYMTIQVTWLRILWGLHLWMVDGPVWWALSETPPWVLEQPLDCCFGLGCLQEGPATAWLQS